MQAPHQLNFQLAQTKAVRRAQREEEARLQAEREAQEEEDRRREAETEEAASEQGQPTGPGMDVTLLSMGGDGETGAGGRKSGLPAKSRGIPTVRGGKTAAQRKKDANIKFAAPIISTLPLEYREKQVSAVCPGAQELANVLRQPQRADMETVIGALREHHRGLRGTQLDLSSEARR